MEREAVEGAVDFAVANATQEPRTRLAGAGYIQGLAYDYYRGARTRTGSRLGAAGALVEKIIDGGPPSANLAAWFRYNTGITVAGSGVSVWADQSGNGRNLLQGTDTNRPALQSDGSILFDGVDNYLKCSAFTLNQPETVYILFRSVTWTDQDRIYDGNATTTMTLWQRGTTPIIRSLGSGGQTAANSNLAVNAYGAVASVFNGASSLVQVNLTTATTGDVGASNAGGFTLGADGGTLTGFSNIEVKEVIIYSAAHDAATRANVIRYLASVGGISV